MEDGFSSIDNHSSPSTDLSTLQDISNSRTAMTEIQKTQNESKLRAVTSDIVSMGAGRSGLSSQILEQCKILNGLLNVDPRSSTEASVSSSKTSTADFSQSTLSVVPPQEITPWSVDRIAKSLPELPSVRDQELEVAAFSHSGVVSNPSLQSYERLEWVGDAYVYLISTLLISATFTSHLPGKCAQIRELLVKNETLAEYARLYGFEARVRLPAEFIINKASKHSAKDSGRVKVLGDVFEAYVAAVIFSDPEAGVERVSKWLKDLWSITIADRIRDNEYRNMARQAKNVDVRNLNPKDTLVREIGAKGIKFSYRDAAPERKDPITGHPIFTVSVHLDGWGEKGLQLGIGSDKGKKDAGMKAAEMALANEEMMEVFRAKKRAFDKTIKPHQSSTEGR